MAGDVNDRVMVKTYLFGYLLKWYGDFYSVYYRKSFKFTLQKYLILFLNVYPVNIFLNRTLLLLWRLFIK